ncbi:Tryptophan synthase beta chain [Penicillium cosmopolitanum]|uniref:tryptophan synthase n=1 Tax=Penicillium cosmopolitanum TaxID=1131564 RepID=A0A9W9VXP9_9EURO|nr:Tryptophan synthase beta chain [Penicillium cosmopolitanum]KAJ5391150.1 Tryptophan synthase beta chain [Penicillium cosmopolitanum]
MFRSMKRLLCFTSPQHLDETESTVQSTHDAPRRTSSRNSTARASCPQPRARERVPTRVITLPVSSMYSTTSTHTYFVSDAESLVTATTSPTSQYPSLSSEVLLKLATDDASWDYGTPYVPILQPDGTLRPPQISFGGYGSFGGQFVPESIMGFLHELTSVFEAAVSDPSFWAEYATFQRSQHTPLTRASKLSDSATGATIWLKREDLNDYGSHKTRNIIGQLLLARRMGRTEVVTDCAAAKHGNFTAAMCARLGLRCVVVMGADDARAQEEDVLEMKMLGAKIVTARTPSGMGSLRAAITEALRYSVCRYESVYYLMGGPVGPSPLPTVTRTFQALLGEEVAAQMHREVGCQPDAVVTAVGSGCGAVGLFRPFLHSPAVILIGVEGVHAAALTEGSLGVLQGSRTLMLQNDDGQIIDSYSISPDMNLSTVGPEVAHWKSRGRIEIRTATDADALDGFKSLLNHEGIVSGLDSSHAVSAALSLARDLGPGKNIVLMVTGGDNIGMHDGRRLDV